MNRHAFRPAALAAALALAGCSADGGPDFPLGSGGGGGFCLAPISVGATAAIDPVASATCVSCNVTDLGNLVDADLTNVAVIDQQLSVLTGSIGVTVTQSGSVFPAGQIAGFVLSVPAPLLLSAQALQEITVSTLFNGAPTGDTQTFSTTLSPQVQGLIGSDAPFFVGVATTHPFDAVQIVSAETLANALGQLNVYGACSNATGTGSIPTVP